VDQRLIDEQIKKQILRRALAFLARATGKRDADLPEGVPDFTYAANGMSGYHAPDGDIAAWGSHDPTAQALMRESTGNAYAKQVSHERHGRAHTIMSLPYEAMRALMLAYLDLCQHDNPRQPWPRQVNRLALDAALIACTYPDEKRTAAMHRALVNATRQQCEKAKAIALEAWFPAVRDSKKAP
jgi:hypothetical protein